MKAIEIADVCGYEIIDSRGNPTVMARVTFSDGTTGEASVPSGASTGSHEAHELRDGDLRFCGKGVATAVKNINNIIAPGLIKMKSPTQQKADKYMAELDGTKNKSRLGANAILAVSLAFARASASFYKIPLYRYIGGINGCELPVPMMNILNGGAHAANNIDIQEFMIFPVGINSFSERLRAGCEIYSSLGKLLKEKGLSTTVGDEGGYAPSLEKDEEAIELILEAIKIAGYSHSEIKITLDAASTEWFRDGKYYLPKRKREMTTDELIDYWESLCEKYPIASIEDGLSENDFEGWKKLTERLGNKIQLVGDDFFVTNTERLKKGIEEKCVNSILIKYNQIGTLTETLDAVETAKKAGYSSVISHRSGETEDSFIADLSVAVNSGQIKTGAPARTDRCAKYNRLLIIESELI